MTLTLTSFLANDLRTVFFFPIFSLNFSFFLCQYRLLTLALKTILVTTLIGKSLAGPHLPHPFCGRMADD